jgi:hypothetical protein
MAPNVGLLHCPDGTWKTRTFGRSPIRTKSRSGPTPESRCCDLDHNRIQLFNNVNHDPQNLVLITTKNTKSSLNCGVRRNHNMIQPFEYVNDHPQNLVFVELQNTRSSSASITPTWWRPRTDDRSHYVDLKIDEPLPVRLECPPVFTPWAERELAERVVLLSKCFLEITRTEIRKCAYEYAHQNNIKHPFTEENKSAGFD